MMRRRALFLSLTVAVSVGVSACTPTPTPTPTATPDAAGAIATAELFFNSMLTGDGAVVCGLSLRDGAVVTPEDPSFSACVSAVKGQSDYIAPLLQKEGVTSITVGAVTVSGDSATIDVKDLNADPFQGLHSQFHMLKINGEWYMDSRDD